MTRYWINLATLQHRINNLPYAESRADAIKWLHTEELGWFDSMERLNAFVRNLLMPALEEAWAANPHWRFGQLISNAVGGDHDPYYVPDGTMRDKLLGLRAKE